MLSNPFVIIGYLGYFTFFAEIFIIQMLFMRKFPRRSYFILRVLGSIVLAGAFSVVPKLPIGFVDTMYFFVLFYTIVAATVCFRANALNAVFYGLTAWATQHFAWSILMVVCLTVAMTTAWTAVVYVLIYACSYALLFFIFSFRKKEYEVTKEKLYVVLISAIILFLTTILYDCAQHFDGNSVWYSIYAAVSCVLVLCTQFGISSREELIRQREQLEIEKSVLENLLYRQTRQQKLTGETVEIINRKCHDLKHQINLLRSMRQAESGEYLNEIEKAVMVYGDIAKTGNYALDITLTEKCLLCEEHKIRFTYIVDGASLNMMKAVDVSTLFGNMLDNAIECEDGEEEERRIVRLNVSAVHGYLRIHCENYCSRAVAFEDGLPVSERQDSGYHGFGSKSIRYIAEKYGGTVVMEHDGELFNVNILLPISPPAEDEEE